MSNEETLEYGLLQHIKMCLECNNESQAIRLIEKYGFEKQEERYSEEEVMDMFHNLSMHLPLHYEFLVKEQFKNKQDMGTNDLVCSGCLKKDHTVDRDMFDGLCAVCTTRALYDENFEKKAKERNEQFKNK